jgi:hypothetical protein
MSKPPVYGYKTSGYDPEAAFREITPSTPSVKLPEGERKVIKKGRYGSLLDIFGDTYFVLKNRRKVDEKAPVIRNKKSKVMEIIKRELKKDPENPKMLYYSKIFGGA